MIQANITKGTIIVDPPYLAHLEQNLLIVRAGKIKPCNFHTWAVNIVVSSLITTSSKPILKKEFTVPMKFSSFLS